MSARAESLPGRPAGRGGKAGCRVAPRRAVAAVTLLAIALILSLEASAGIAADGRQPTAVESMARVPASARRPTLRCWQYGRLVYEASDIQLIRDGPVHGDGAAAESTTIAAPGVVSVSPPERANARSEAKLAERQAAGADGRRRVRLLDLNQGLCIID